MLDVVSSFFLAHSWNWNWNCKLSQMTLLISECYPTTVFLWLHVFQRWGNNKREASIYIVGPLIYKPHLKTSEYMKTMSHFLKNYNLQWTTFILNIKFSETVACPHPSMSPSMKWFSLPKENKISINAYVLMILNFKLILQKSKFESAKLFIERNSFSLTQKIDQVKFFSFTQRVSLMPEEHQTTKLPSQTSLNRNVFSPSVNIASHFWPGNCTAQL